MFKVLTPELGAKMMRRALIIGGPNTFKTHAIVHTFPRPLHLISYPGEKGTGTIPTNQPDLKGYIWEEDDPSKIVIATAINDIEKTTWEFLMGKNGEIKTFAGEGLHKLASLYWNREYTRLLAMNEKQITEGKLDRNGLPLEEGLKLQAYGNENYGSCKEIMAYVSRVCQSNVDTVVFTCWEGVEVEDKELAGAQGGKRHIFADLPGKLARKIVGEFGVVMYAEVGLPGPDGRSTGTWQIRKAGSVWGVGVKAPFEIALKLPARIPQNWSKLYPLLLGVVEKAK